MSQTGQFKLIVLLGTLALLFFGVYFYMERCIMIDTSFYIFYMLKDNIFQIQHHRIFAVFTQLLPMLLFNLDVSVKYIMLSYSINTVLVWIVFAFLSAWIWRDYKSAVAILISPFLFNSKEFFWMVSEAQFLPAIWIFVAAYMLNVNFNERIILKALFLIVLLLLAITVHPLSIFTLAFLILFLLIKGYYKKNLLLFISATVLVFVIKAVLMPASPYDQSAMTRIANFQYVAPNYWYHAPNKILLSNLSSQFYFIPIMLLLCLLSFAGIKKFFWGFLYCLGIIGYFFFINVCFYELNDQAVLFLENIYQPIIPALLIPVFFSSNSFRNNKLLVVISLTALFFGVFRYWESSKHFTKRLEWERSLISKYGTEKVAISTEHVPMDLLEHNWCVPYEIALLSSAENEYCSSIFVFASEEEKSNIEDRGRHIVTVFKPIRYDWIPSDIFRYTDSVNCYSEVIPY
jgi:hypothetical protein